MTREHAGTLAALQRATEELARATADAAQLTARRTGLEAEREVQRGELATRRAAAQAVQLAMRDLHVRVESRRSTESSVAVAVGRMAEQREQLHKRRMGLEEELASRR